MTVKFVAGNGCCAKQTPLVPAVFTNQVSYSLVQVIKGKSPASTAQAAPSFLELCTLVSLDVPDETDSRQEGPLLLLENSSRDK